MLFFSSRKKNTLNSLIQSGAWLLEKSGLVHLCFQTELCEVTDVTENHQAEKSPSGRHSFSRKMLLVQQRSKGSAVQDA
ncbi:hypothetical protein E2562_037162 [Oryza meyeriana var. granulata]|uniref:Uncharacterized protein n=1 Tax=Oryza meyeriana var. granulata TaxID=110450 RepID=A0A6G1CJZ2_9ORYZ|nr:hypothetical protein E2562_037162 [Oryza meyeriana var. granulata]KAF0900966.1 hypothetical protein E2562_037162 [Oryza meyeriana var. granulata]KAF0900967.1 hypothetical protein E2562_037162 [Oryza meyeriana var. granulata]KAF0900968.1 hypothetical protein E2562_037162 [Oryza meyeriana var. granulata]KAF0900969.1 hypothetical protein E2562_037162 [Oryza meyeriana var. granulata]